MLCCLVARIAADGFGDHSVGLIVGIKRLTLAQVQNPYTDVKRIGDVSDCVGGNLLAA